MHRNIPGQQQMADIATVSDFRATNKCIPTCTLKYEVLIFLRYILVRVQMNRKVNISIQNQRITNFHFTIKPDRVGVTCI